MSKLPNKSHPAVSAYQELSRQETNPAYLHYTLAQQIWFDARVDPERRPTEYAMTLLRVMSYAFLLSKDYTEDEVHDRLVDAMEGFEKAYRGLASRRTKDADRPMVRTRPPGSNVMSGSNIIPFPQARAKRHDDGKTD